MLDVLGFSERIVRGPELNGLKTYVNTVMKMAGFAQIVGAILFSDTIVFYTLDDEFSSFQNWIDHISRLSSL